MSLSKGLVLKMRLDKESFNPATKRFTDLARENHGTGHGTQLGSATPGFQADQMGQLVRSAPFNGSDDYINCGSNSDLVFGTGNFSLSALIYPTTGSTFPSIIGKGDVGAGEWMLRYPDTTSLSFYGCTQNIVVTSIITYLDMWSHVVFIRNGDNAYIYINGALKGSESGIAALNFSTPKDLRIGNADGAANRFFKGNMNYVRIYNKALSQQERTLLNDSYRV